MKLYLYPRLIKRNCLDHTNHWLEIENRLRPYPIQPPLHPSQVHQTHVPKVFLGTGQGILNLHSIAYSQENLDRTENFLRPSHYILTTGEIKGKSDLRIFITVWFALFSRRTFNIIGSFIWCMKYQYLPSMVKATHISNIVFIRHKRDADIIS